MDRIKVIIADDDQPSRTILSHFARLSPEYEVVSEVSNGEELIESVVKEKPDIALVDINMPGINGFEAVKIFKKVLPTIQVIFTTGHDEFAVAAFNISAVDYIVKPIERTRLFMALEKAKKLLKMQQSIGNQSTKTSSNKLSIKSNGTFLYLSIDEIFYIEKEGRKTLIHVRNSIFETSDSLQEIENKLPEYFYKTHRSYLVNLKKIIKIEPFGETYLARFSGTDKVAYISKLKVQEVYGLLGS
ncbi:LytTR family DNA-binding domain-containing protein [Robertmurraya massiliosenegalensis]|uniref:LytR/AlgR family response regulator transcription factor n=1 Tax=Robertmurraya TaxID=2837507 RepID=UPI0039A49C7E